MGLKLNLVRRSCLRNKLSVIESYNTKVEKNIYNIKHRSCSVLSRRVKVEKTPKTLLKY